MAEVSDRIAMMLNDIEAEGSVGSLMHETEDGRFIFHRILPSTTYVFTEDEIEAMWQELDL